ncbi:MAG: HlyC/CorC family transporter [Ruminococcus sp.]|nr:HlyC/CorC family transporter [Ruminococcus sp.]
MDDVGRSCLAGGIALLLLIILFTLTAAQSCILDCSENKIRALFEEKKDARAKRLLALKEKRQEIRVTGLALHSIITVLFAALMIFGVLPPLREALEGLTEKGGAVLAYLCILLISAVLIPLCVNIPRRLSGYEVIAEGFALSTCGAYAFLMLLLTPLTKLVDSVTGLYLRLSGVKDTEKEEPVSEEEILMLVDAGNESGDIDENQAEMITNIFEFDDLEAKDVMTHRIDITGIERSAPVREAAELAISEGFSRIPVYDGTIDSLCGVIYSKDLLKLLFENKTEGLTAGEVCREISFVPESIKCGELFEQMSASRAQIAALVDEYGGTAGIVTMEDLLEAIVGSIEDEFDEGEDREIIPISGGSFDVSGTAKPEEVMEALEAQQEIPDGFDTIGGFVIDLLGFIPNRLQKPTVKWNGIKFTVLRADETKIEKLRVKKLSSASG